uniref:uncharacterized protein LOC122609708 n=1 Tax=Erigeron canadensis TaxID=72917 RepID=UPI001CB8A225|nr:uncharacterized protein LOC122609708 [Erigeron canadensis]
MTDLPCLLCICFLPTIYANCMQHFEAFFVGHFRCRARDILMACQGYLNGRFLNGELEKRCSIAFKNEVASCMKPLTKAFIRIGSQEAFSFLRLSEDTITVPRELGSSEMPVVRVIVDDEISQPNETENEEGPSDCPAKRQFIRMVGVDFKGTNPTPRRAQDNVTGQVDLHTVAAHLNSYRSLLSKLACSDGIVVSRQSVLSQLARLDEIQVSQQSLLRMSKAVSQAVSTASAEYDPFHIDIVEDAQGNERAGP